MRRRGSDEQELQGNLNGSGVWFGRLLYLKTGIVHYVTELRQKLSDPYDATLPDHLFSYRMIVMVQVNAEFLNETVQKVKSKELCGFQEAVVILALVKLVDAVEQKIPDITPPDILKS